MRPSWHVRIWLPTKKLNWAWGPDFLLRFQCVDVIDEVTGLNSVSNALRPLPGDQKVVLMSPALSPNPLIAWLVFPAWMAPSWSSVRASREWPHWHKLRGGLRGKDTPVTQEIPSKFWGSIPGTLDKDQADSLLYLSLLGIYLVKFMPSLFSGKTALQLWF